MRVALHGDPPEHVRDVLTHAGLQITYGYDELHLVWLDDAGQEALSLLTDQGKPALALIEGDEQLLEAVLAGASGVVSGTNSQRLRVELECHLRLRHQLQTPNEDPLQKEEASLFRAIIQAIPDPVICADLRGHVTHFNQASVTSLGYSNTYAATQRHVTDFYANPTDARRVLTEIRASSDRVLRNFPVRLRARSGEHIPVLLSATEVLDENGAFISTVGIFRDQRVEHDLRHRLKQATQQLIQSEKRANAVARTKSAAHELNQPLTALMGALELLDLRGDLPDDIRRRLERMYGQLDRMADIVRSLGQQSVLDDQISVMSRVMESTD